MISRQSIRTGSDIKTIGSGGSDINTIGSGVNSINSIGSGVNSFGSISIGSGVNSFGSISLNTIGSGVNSINSIGSGVNSFGSISISYLLDASSRDYSKPWLERCVLFPSRRHFPAANYKESKGSLCFAASKCISTGC
jgi:hypothetical protein